VTVPSEQSGGVGSSARDEKRRDCLLEEDAETCFVTELPKFSVGSTVFVCSSRFSAEGTMGKAGKEVNL